MKAGDPFFRNGLGGLGRACLRFRLGRRWCACSRVSSAWLWAFFLIVVMGAEASHAGQRQVFFAPNFRLVAGWNLVVLPQGLKLDDSLSIWSVQEGGDSGTLPGWGEMSGASEDWSDNAVWVYSSRSRSFMVDPNVASHLPLEPNWVDGWNLYRVPEPKRHQNPHVVRIVAWDAKEQRYQDVRPGATLEPKEVYFADYVSDLRRPPGSATFSASFNGKDAFVEVPDHDAYSQPTTGALSVEAWIRPDALRMPRIQSSGYVNWLGKGIPREYEWTFRMYSLGNREGRGNRISFYAMNAEGGLGVGSYFQDELEPKAWIHVVATLTQTHTTIFRDGAYRKDDSLNWVERNVQVRPTNQKAPLRIGTRDGGSYFQGALARVAIYGVVLSEAQIEAHYAAGGTSGYDSLILGEPGLVGYWPLDEVSGTVAFDRTGNNDGVYKGPVVLGLVRWEP